MFRKKSKLAKNKVKNGGKLVHNEEYELLHQLPGGRIWVI